MRPCDHCGATIGSGDERCGACDGLQTWAEQLERRRRRLGEPVADEPPDPALRRAARMQAAQSLLAFLVAALVFGVGGWVAAGVAGAAMGVALAALAILALPIIASM